MDKDANSPLFPVRLETTGKWGYIDASGNLAIPPRFDFAADFCCDRACVGLRPPIRMVVPPPALFAYRVINRKGEAISDTAYAHIVSYSEGRAFARTLESGVFGYDVASLGGYIDKQGAFVVRPRFTQGGPYSEGLAAVCWPNGKWGFIDGSGEVRIPAQFESCGPFREGLAAASKDGKMGFVDKRGEWVILPAFQEVSSFSEGLAAARRSTRSPWGYLSKEGAWRIEPSFMAAGNFSQGRAAVRESENWGFINEKGGWVVPPTYDRCLGFHEGRAPVHRPGVGWQYIGLDGHVAIPGPFTNAQDFRNGLAAVNESYVLGEIGPFDYIDINGAYVWRWTLHCE